ncbi:hypothetical protein B9Y80_05950 [Stenotrophomonas maltophilia]|nr:hypothetical protein B9Y71_06255 [Stenotrophomonas maltophilia]PJL38670.1 hypothetical protein B9Y80_05950 [Stenotrophomonas maltophilia]
MRLCEVGRVGRGRAKHPPSIIHRPRQHAFKRLNAKPFECLCQGFNLGIGLSAPDLGYSQCCRQRTCLILFDTLAAGRYPSPVHLRLAAIQDGSPVVTGATGSPPFSRTLTRRPIKAMRSVHVEAKEVQHRVQARCG